MVWTPQARSHLWWRRSDPVLALATSLNGTGEHSDPEAADEQVQDHLGRDKESRGLTGG